VTEAEKIVLNLGKNQVTVHAIEKFSMALPKLTKLQHLTLNLSEAKIGTPSLHNMANIG
jgi:hypothetical protein